MLACPVFYVNLLYVMNIVLEHGNVISHHWDNKVIVIVIVMCFGIMCFDI